jgi:hypothetical protein
MQIGVHAMVDARRNAWLDMPYAEPDQPATPLANLTAQVAGSVIEASENV